jgi:hypothetical protein
MKPGEFKKFLEFTPFRPFAIHMASGEVVRVKSREMIFPLPSLRTVIVVTGRKIGDDDEWKILDTAMINSVTVPAGREEKSRKRSA